MKENESIQYLGHVTGDKPLVYTICYEGDRLYPLTYKTSDSSRIVQISIYPKKEPQ